MATPVSAGPPYPTNDPAPTDHGSLFASGGRRIQNARAKGRYNLNVSLMADDRGPSEDADDQP